MDSATLRALEDATRDTVRAVLEANPALRPQDLDLSGCPPPVTIDGIPPLPGESAMEYLRRVESMPGVGKT